MKDFKEQVAKKRKLALYAHMDPSMRFYTVFEVTFVNHDARYQALGEGQLRELPMQGYTRVSEIIEVSFDSVSNDQVIQNAIAALDAAEQKAIEDLNRKIAEIRDQKAQLLALTHQPESVDG